MRRETSGRYAYEFNFIHSVAQKHSIERRNVANKLSSLETCEKRERDFVLKFYIYS